MFIQIEAYQEINDFDMDCAVDYLNENELSSCMSGAKNKGKQQQCARVMLKNLCIQVISLLKSWDHQKNKIELIDQCQKISFQPYHIPQNISPFMITIAKDTLGAPHVLLNEQMIEALQISISHDENMVYVMIAFDLDRLIELLSL